MRLFYVIIINNIHNNIFHNKKTYKSLYSKYHLGVYHYDNYIIRIDDAHNSFESENEVVKKIKCNDPNIILPFISYINVAEKKTLTNERDSEQFKCNTSITQERGCVTYSQHLHDMFINDNISFSVQPYIKNTNSLLNWIGDNITDSIDSNLFEIRNTVIINIFYKCACLIETLHLQNVVHGDIKPDNILFKELNNFKLNNSEKNKNFEIYLIDFGLSGIESVSLGTGGTTPYCHPDFRNIRDIRDSEEYRWSKIKKKHDVWSLGLAFITLYIYGKFNSYYYKFPPYFFDDKGYVTNLVIETISNKNIKYLFKDILTTDSISITEVKERLNNIIIKNNLQYNNL
jgi:serine/threonine protein kinase